MLQTCMGNSVVSRTQNPWSLQPWFPGGGSKVAIAITDATYRHDWSSNKEGRSFFLCICHFKGKKISSQRPSGNIPSYPLSKITAMAAREMAKRISVTFCLYRRRMSLPACKVEGGAAVGGMLGQQSHPPTWVNPNPLPWEEAQGVQGHGAHGTFTPHILCPYPSLLSLSTYIPCSPPQVDLF